MREYARRGGKLRRREARDLVKIDVNKTSRIWDFLVQAGFLKINLEPTLSQNPRSVSLYVDVNPMLIIIQWRKCERIACQGFQPNFSHTFDRDGRTAASWAITLIASLASWARVA